MNKPQFNRKSVLQVKKNVFLEVILNEMLLYVSDIFLQKIHIFTLNKIPAIIWF